MKKRIVIVSTYPAQGSKNIGDKLITNHLINAISEFGDYDFDIIWRAETWETVKDVVLSASHVFFACLAIRPKMHKIEYPYLKDVVESGVPFSVIAAGTALNVGTISDIYSSFSTETRDLLKRVNEKATVATTRGYLSQEACHRLRLNKFIFSGDVAFYDSSRKGEEFRACRKIKKIVISDPHRSGQYLESFSALYDGIVDLFPGADVVVAQHGINYDISAFCESRAVKTEKIYENSDSGLDIYDDADLHVGFRVHAHVSALSRRVYSYLLEQDGRGCDYGLTINRKISVPNYPVQRAFLGLKSIAKMILRREMPTQGVVPISPAQQLIAMIRADKELGFQKFNGLEEQIESFNRNNRKAIEVALSGPDL